MVFILSSTACKLYVNRHNLIASRRSVLNYNARKCLRLYDKVTVVKVGFFVMKYSLNVLLIRPFSQNSLKPDFSFSAGWFHFDYYYSGKQDTVAHLWRSFIGLHLIILSFISLGFQSPRRLTSFLLLVMVSNYNRLDSAIRLYDQVFYCVS